MEQRIAELEARLAAAEAVIYKLTARLERFGEADRGNEPFRVVEADGRRVFQFIGDIEVFPSSSVGNNTAPCVGIGAGTAGGYLGLHHVDGQPSVLLGTFPSGGHIDIISAEGEWNVITLEAREEAGAIEVVQKERNEATNGELPGGIPVFRV